MGEAKLQHNPQRQRYELVADGQVVGVADYQSAGDVIRLTHTEVAPEYNGKGYGSMLAQQALDLLRGEGKRIVPACAFIAAYIERHPQYKDMVAS